MSNRNRTAQDERAVMTNDESRAPMAAADAERNDDAGWLDAAERRALIRGEFTQEALPSAPDVPGWHFCWLAVNSTYDPIHKRMRLGYVPVKPEEIMGRGFENMKMTSGEFEGCIACNEMVLFKIPEARYQAIMAEFHHHMPLEDEQGIWERMQEQQAMTDRSGNKLLGPDAEDQGFRSLDPERNRTRVPTF